jgi:hypothetical protein
MNHIIVQKNNKWGLLNHNCVIKLPIVYDDIKIIDESIIKLVKDNQQFIINENGKTISF